VALDELARIQPAPAGAPLRPRRWHNGRRDRPPKNGTHNASIAPRGWVGYGRGVPLSPGEFYAHALTAADAERRLPLSRMTGWEVFPFEPDGLRVVPLDPPVIPEPARQGEDCQACRACARNDNGIWSDEHWRVVIFAEPTGAPLLLIVEPVEHFDLANLPDDRAAELGKLLAHLARAVEALPHIARAHISRWGDGSAHLHVFVYARPEGFSQLRGTCMAIWDDLLPATPVDQRDADAAAVASALAASYGGTTAG
jgi:diadenosine tetraphosphate (Ap4A) HIT family hydrolase